MSQTKTSPDVAGQIAEIMGRARAAQDAIADYTQDQVDELVTAVAWAVVRKDRAEALAQLTVDEGGFGNYADKLIKINKRVTGVLADMRSVRTVGVVEEDPVQGLVKIAKPVGVVAALIPTTGPDATPPVKALFALKGRNAIVVAPHPRTQASTALVVGYMREACRQVGAPADLVQVVSEPSMAKTAELMRQADLVVATGGAGMVKAAYGSGTPAYGVGVGNSVHVVDETADLDAAAAAIAAATGVEGQLTDFQVHAVTGGGDALGHVVVQMEADGFKVSGRGVSTDVVEASARAYLNAVNRIVRLRERGEEREIEIGP